MLFPRSSAARSYRHVARVAGRALPAVDKALRLRCTLSAADHSIVGVSALVLHLGYDVACDQQIELVHDARGDAPPRYFELSVSLAPAAAPSTRLRLAQNEHAGADPYFHRIAGTIDPAQGRIILPEIVLQGG
jgi:hypothetical protein